MTTKLLLQQKNEEIFTSYSEVIYENDDFLCIIAHRKVSDPETRYRSFITAINYKDGKILSQKTTVQELDFDPSEHLDWNWADFE